MGASESKLEFKEDIFRLAGGEVIPLESSWWLRFIQLPETAEDVQALWSPNDLRNLTLNPGADRPSTNTQTAPKKNVETLIYRTVGRLQTLQTKRVLEDPNASIAPEVLNSVRILTRLLPYIYEADHLNEWEDRFFWLPRKPVLYVDRRNNRYTYKDGLTAEIVPEEQKDQELGRPLGEQLVDLLIGYLFFPGFTLPAKRDVEGLPDLKPTYVVWQSGIGANKGAGLTKEHERNATEVLRLLLTLASRTMYISPGVVAERDLRPLTYMTTKSDRAIVLNMICSLLNTVLKYNQNPWTFPVDLGAVTKDSKQPLVANCLQLLLVLTTYSVPDGGANEFRKALGRLHRAEDFQFIVEGLRQILIQPTSGAFHHMPRLTTSSMPPIAPEALSLFWELLQCNKRFRSYLIDTDRARDFVVLLLYYAIEPRDDPARQGLVRMCIFILQTLSVEEKFGRKLNWPFANQETLPTVLQFPHFHGTYADFLIGHIHTLLTSPNRALEPLQPALLAIINNIAPYVQGLERATSSMLLNVFVTMSQPSFLLANESNHVLLTSLLDTINAILEHQYEENRRFVEVVVKSHKRFEALRDLTVERALAEVDKMAMERKDAGEPAGVRSPARNASLDSVRSPASTRSPSLGNVPEDDAFAIGDEDDEDEESMTSTGAATPVSVSSSAVEDALPMQSRRMSEKARGKQPVGQATFSRPTSRNTSNASLPSLNTHASSHVQAQAFTPNNEWLYSWLPHLPLHTILNVISRQRMGVPDLPPTTTTTTNTTTNTFASTNTTKNTSVSATSSAATAADTVDAAPAVNPSITEHSSGQVKVQTFRWTSLALGWYLSLLWGRIYASDSGRVWTGTSIKLFNVVVSQRQEVSLRSPKGAVDAVGNTIAQRLSSISFSGGGTT